MVLALASERYPGGREDMSLHITRRDIEEAHRYARDAIGRVRSYSNTGEHVVGQVTQTVEVGLGAVGVGILSGYFGPLNIAGSPVPLDLAAGVAGHQLAFMGLAGRHAEHLHNFSDGVMAGYLAKFGVGYGKSLAQKAGKTPAPVFSGQSRDFRGQSPIKQLLGNAISGTFTGAEPLSEAELAAMAQATR